MEDTGQLVVLVVLWEPREIGLGNGIQDRLKADGVDIALGGSPWCRRAVLGEIALWRSARVSTRGQGAHRGIGASRHNAQDELKAQQAHEGLN